VIYFHDLIKLNQLHEYFSRPTNYLASVNGAANQSALYLIKSGDNDATYVNNQSPAWIAANPNYLSDGAAALAVAVARLQTAGARFIVVRNSYDSAYFAGLGGDIPSSNAAFYARSKALGTSEWSNLTAMGVHFIPADNDSLFRFVVHNPTLFGFTPSSVVSANAPSPVPTAILAIATPAQQQDYLFVNGPHLSTAGQTIEADYTYSLLTAPSDISLMAENSIQSGLSRTATIQRQVELSGQARGPKELNAWAAAGYGYSKTETESYFPSDSGNPAQGTIGADYRTASGIIFGGALTAGYQSQDFSTGGNFDQDEQTMSVYSAYQYGQFWGNAIASYGLIQNDINRSVKLGIFTDQNNGDADGHSISLAFRGGHDFKIGQFTTGPVVGAIFQEARIDGFTEHGTTGVTALSFNSQTRDSQVTQLGWRGSVELGDWKPFVEATWNHEWNDDDRTVTTTLTSVSAPAYNTLATPVAADWGNATIGASYKINQRTMIWGSFSEVFGSSEMTNYGGELGLRISF